LPYYFARTEFDVGSPGRARKHISLLAYGEIQSRADQRIGVLKGTTIRRASPYSIKLKGKANGKPLFSVIFCKDLESPGRLDTNTGGPLRAFPRDQDPGTKKGKHSRSQGTDPPINHKLTIGPLVIGEHGPTKGKIFKRSVQGPHEKGRKPLGNVKFFIQHTDIGITKAKPPVPQGKAKAEVPLSYRSTFINMEAPTEYPIGIVQAVAPYILKRSYPGIGPPFEFATK
jgi:hypothetical protein